jgi:hypothetical protein
MAKVTGKDGANMKGCWIRKPKDQVDSVESFQLIILCFMMAKSKMTIDMDI